MRAIQCVAVACVLGSTLVAVHAQQVYKAGDGVSLPTAITQVKAQYTQEAMAARIEGVVQLNATVRTDGTVTDVTVTRSLDKVLGLDAEAVKALKQWTFKPGQKDGKDVAVNLDFRMNFTLQ